MLEQYICNSFSLVIMQRVKIVFSYFVGLLIIALHIQCKDIKTENDIDAQTKNISNNKITANDISQIKYTEYVLSNLSEKRTNDWLKFKLLSTEIDDLKKGDLSFFVDDKTILTGFIDGLISETPELLNVPSIMVRISVIKTAIFKLEESYSLLSTDKRHILNNIEDLLLAHNHLLLQINKRVEKESRNIEKPQ